MTTLVALLAGIAGLCLELFVREALALDAWTPNFLVVVVMWISVSRSATQGALLVAFLGLLGDGFAGSPAGLLMLHSLLLLYVGRLIARRVLFSGFVGRILLGLAAGLISLFLLALISRLLLSDAPVHGRLNQLLVPRVMVIVILLPLTFPILLRLDGAVAGRPDKDLL